MGKEIFLAGPNGAGKTTFAREFLTLEAGGCVGALRQFRGPPCPARLGREAMIPKPIEQAKNPLLARALPALLRARKRAEELAAATNTAIVQVVDGKVVRLRAPFRESDSAM